MRNSGSLPLIISDCNSSIFKSKSKVSLHTLKANEKYKQAFEILGNSSGNATVKQLEQLKKINFQGMTKSKFKEIIGQINEISKEHRFLSQNLEIFENKPEKGFIDQDCLQFFEIFTRNCPSPLKICVKAHKGKVKTFASFKCQKPNASSYEFVCETENLEIYGKNPRFLENKCFLSVFAVRDSNVTILCTFPNKNLDGFEDIPGKKDLKFSFKYRKDIEDMQNNPGLRNKFEKKVQIILDKRRKIESLNFINLNKTVNIPEQNMEQKKIQKTSKITENKIRKAAIDDEKSSILELNMYKKEIRELAEKKAVKIQGIYFRKLFFEKNWLAISYFSISILEIQRFLKAKKQIKLRYFLIQMQARRIQKNYRLHLNKLFSMKIRSLALCRNGLKLFRLCMKPYAIYQSKRKISVCLKEAGKHQKISKKMITFNVAYKTILLHWKRYMKTNQRRFLELLSFWNNVANALAAEYSGGKARKKKRVYLEKILSIPLSIKENIIKKHLFDCKTSYLKNFKTAGKVPKFEYMIDPEHLKSIIITITQDKGKPQTRTSQHAKK